jgi:hypothetical protein
MGVLAFVPDVPSKQAKLSFVPRFPRRLTSTLGLSFLDCVSKVRRGIPVRRRTVRWCPLKEDSMNDPEIYSWHAAYQSAVLETDSSLISERIF